MANDFAQHAAANIARIFELVRLALDQLAVIIKAVTPQAVFCCVTCRRMPMDRQNNRVPRKDTTGWPRK
jgi:hypothetical protein